MKKSDRMHLKPYIAQFYRGNRWAFALALLSTLLIGLMNLLLAWLLQQMIDAASGLPGAYGLPALVGMTAGGVLLIVLIKWISYLFKPRFMKKAMEQYKAYAFDKLMGKSIAAFQREATSTYLSAFTADATTIEAGYLENVFDLLFDGVRMVGGVVMMLWYNPILAMVAVALFMLPIGASLMSGKHMTAVERRVSDSSEGFIATMKDGLSGFPVVKSFKAEGAVRRLFAGSSQVLEEAKCHKRQVSTLLSILGGVAGVTAQFGTFLVGMYLALKGFAITPGTLILFTDLTGNVIDPISELPGRLARRRSALGLIDKLASALELNVRDEGRAIPAQLDQGIELKEISFGYEAGQEILHGISAQLEAGKRYAIVGASGSGKSTLLNLLMASHMEYEGEIRYDGQELRGISSESLYDLISVIQQNVFLFNDSIVNNITLFQPFAPEKVARAIALSGLQELVERQGADYLCGENGANLSGGEKQRISIARSLLRETSVLLADEATAALDRETAWQVTDALLSLEGPTRIVITHALDAVLLRRYDAILMLKGGRLTEMGTFDELMEARSDFYALYTTAQ